MVILYGKYQKNHVQTEFGYFFTCHSGALRHFKLTYQLLYWYVAHEIKTERGECYCTGDFRAVLLYYRGGYHRVSWRVWRNRRISRKWAHKRRHRIHERSPDDLYYPAGILKLGTAAIQREPAADDKRKAYPATACFRDNRKNNRRGNRCDKVLQRSCSWCIGNL